MATFSLSEVDELKLRRCAASLRALSDMHGDLADTMLVHAELIYEVLDGLSLRIDQRKTE